MHLGKLTVSLLLTLAPLGALSQTPTPFPGTIPVTDIDTQKLLTRMNSGDGQFIAVAAHRGYWQVDPENSLQSIADAYDRGIEAVEIDVRLASTLTSGFFAAAPNYGILNDTNGGLLLSHDECVDRVTSGSGAMRGAASSKCLSKAGFSFAAYHALKLRDRTGNLATYGPPSLAEAFTTFSHYLSQDANGKLHGPVLVIDLKDKDVQAPVSGACSECMAWNEYIYGLSIMRATLPSYMWPAVIWKLKMAAALPSATVVTNEIAAHPTYGQLVLTINPEDVSNTAGPEPDIADEILDGEVDQAGYGPTGASFQILLRSSLTDYQTPPYINQFEWVPFNANDGSNPYLTAGITKLPELPSLSSFATYYQPSFYPEGVAQRFGTCCYLAPINQAENLASGSSNQALVDTRGTLDFATFYSGFSTPVPPNAQTATITSDNLAETMNFLVAAGYRHIAEIQ